MNLGFEVTSARSKKVVDDDYRTTVPMRPTKDARNPSTDQKKTRRQMNARTASEENAMSHHDAQSLSRLEARLQGALATAPSLAQQRAISQELDVVRAKRRRAVAEARETDLANAVIADQMTPVLVHSMHTQATDWVGEWSEEEMDDPTLAMRTQATLWFNKTSAEVKEDFEEFSEQARGVARLHAGSYGSRADEAAESFLSHVDHLYKRAGGDDKSSIEVKIEQPQSDDDDHATTTPEGGDHASNSEHDPINDDGPSRQEREDDDSVKGTAGDDMKTGTRRAARLYNFAALDDQFAFEAADDQSGNADSGLPLEPNADEEPFDAKQHGGDTVLDPTGPTEVSSERAPMVSENNDVSNSERNQETHASRTAGGSDNFGGKKAPPFGSDGKPVDEEDEEKTAKVASNTCAQCGGAIERDPAGENNRSYHHNDGSKHDHEARPGADFAMEGTLRTARAISEIASDVRRDWANVNYGAVPYLDAMSSLNSITDQYGADSAKSIVAYFLSNASSWRGETAKAIKAELKAMMDGKAASQHTAETAAEDWPIEGDEHGQQNPNVAPWTEQPTTGDSQDTGELPEVQSSRGRAVDYSYVQRTASEPIADDSGQAVSGLPDVEVGEEDDKPMWPWEIGETQGFVTSKATAFRNTVQANLKER